MVVGKGITGGYTPLSAVLVGDRIADRFESDADKPFQHGHTFSGNPLSAAIGAHVVEQYTDDALETGRARGRQLVEALAIRVTARRTDGRVAFVAVAVGYFLAYSWTVGQLGPGRGTFGVSVVDDPLLGMRSRMAPYRYEPIATISLGSVD